jgi:uncharacterized protein (TIGR02444 family)
MTAPADNPFWDFSLTVYRKPGVPEACLLLQDEAGVDVNLLLFFCWLATTRDSALDEAAIRDIAARTADWRDNVVRPLRGVRRWMKGRADGISAESAEGLRSEVKRLELASERLQQDMLYRLAGPLPERPPEASAARRQADSNTALYLEFMEAPQTVEVSEARHTVVAASAPA